MTIDLPRARELLKAAVETKGRDFIYNPDGLHKCFYGPSKNGEADSDHPSRTTGCLVGVALSMAGEERHLNYVGGVFELHFNFPDMMTYEAGEYFSEAQSYQDSGSTWGIAFDAAEKWANEQADAEFVKP